MSKPYQLAVFIGRFQPFHFGHQKVVTEAHEIADNLLILVGSSNKAPSLRNPFTFQERKDMIMSSVYEGIFPHVEPLNDYTYMDEKWVEEVREKIAFRVARIGWYDYTPKIVLVGHDKDETTYYLKMFPELFVHDVEIYEEGPTETGEISSTLIREKLLGDDDDIDILGYVTPNTFDIVEEIASTDRFEKLRKEKVWIEEHKSAWKDSPYPPVFVTGDAMVVQGDKVLVVRRKQNPSKGMLALAGGYLNQDEPIVNCALRELVEETQIDVPMDVLRDNIVHYETFDDPKRSERGRIVTGCVLIKLPESLGDISVKASDDAEEAFWMDLKDVSPLTFFEDHAFIIRKMETYI